MVLLSFSLIGFQHLKLRGPESVLIIMAVLTPHDITVPVRLFSFGLDHSAQVPCTEVWLLGWQEIDDTLTASKAIPKYSHDGEKCFISRKLFILNELRTFLLFLWHLFLMSGNELEWLQMGI